ncbi:uncharacterized protein LOC110007463 isoform X2 [Amborella trichopoda]|uniref:uncharacterized protein LOC110007463 isoform X2 n=1 Tax=Amborella trichopoda TaxID=13333 RepID=UPI0009BC8DD5|nr:uncharacterized protein LOC110007463 isoform X2 [Amborella trichopoda]|eukprot:XP_020524284.1 uncharacterized protein LOC110007463 isoform X2 [Amborella trichopoda]
MVKTCRSKSDRVTSLVEGLGSIGWYRGSALLWQAGSTDGVSGGTVLSVEVLWCRWRHCSMDRGNLFCSSGRQSILDKMQVTKVDSSLLGILQEGDYQYQGDVQ